MRVAFAYPNPRRALLSEIAAGRLPDTGLLGQNHLGEYGIEAEVVDSVLRRGRRARGSLHRLTWIGREVTLPFELRRFDAVFTSLSTLLPLAARLRGGPRVALFSYHLLTADEHAGPARRRLLRACVSAASGLVCAAEAARGRLIERFELDPARVRTVHLGVDAQWWQPAPPVRDGHVLAVGRDLARDYETFGRALEGLPVRGIVVAKRENLAGVRLPANVEARFDLSPAEVRDLHRGASCAVVPVRLPGSAVGTENSGTISLLEAMACALPVVVSENDYLAEYVTSGADALTVPPEDPAALRAALERVLGDRALAEGLGAAARLRVEQEHTTRSFAGGLATSLRSFLDRPFALGERG